jgi:poly-gamma-glutamate synthesis protein (capsule biosynthesis protein)
MGRPFLAAALGLALVPVGASMAHAQTPPPSSGRLDGPTVVATGVRIPLRGSEVAPGGRLRIEQRARDGWVRVRSVRAGDDGRYAVAVRSLSRSARHRFRAVAPGAAPSASILVRSRHVVLDAVGDINLGDGPASVMRRRGLRFPWTGVARELRSADVAFGNLECAVSTGGRPVPKQFNFRGRPAALREAARYAGLDVLNLANNHVGDYGRGALLDTLRYVRRFGMTGVGAGRNLTAARRPRVVERLGLRIAFVGFSDILPASFAAGPGRPGTVFATHERIREDVRRAARGADVVVATFHWGVERARRPDGRQRAFARTALLAGADAVIGAHPHVLQPIERRGRRLVAYSLGNFVFSAGSPGTTSTGILKLRLSARGVEGMRFLRARIANTRPVLARRANGA